MPVDQFGPTNIQQGNSAFFTAEFFDSNKNITVPSCAILSVTYTNLNKISQTDLVTLTPLNFQWTGVWSSTSASYGIAHWTLSAGVGSSVSKNGLIRVIDP